MKKFKILVLGDSCEDVYHYGTCDRLSPEAPVPVLKITKIESNPGMCLNVAKNLEGLGASVDVLTHKSQIKKNRFIEEKKLVHLLRVDNELCPVDELVVDDAMNLLTSKHYDAIVISDYDKGFIRNTSISHVITYAKQYEIPVFVDTKKNDVSVYENCILKVNEHEKNNISVFPKNDFEIVTTLGSSGATWRNVVYETKKVKLHDVCGAGDTFLAALVFKYLETASLAAAIKFANICASISVTHFGNFILGDS